MKNLLLNCILEVFMDFGSVGAPFYKTLTGVTMHHVKKFNANTESKAAKYIVTLVAAVALPIFASLDAALDILSFGILNTSFDAFPLHTACKSICLVVKAPFIMIAALFGVDILPEVTPKGAPALIRLKLYLDEYKMNPSFVNFNKVIESFQEAFPSEDSRHPQYSNWYETEAKKREIVLAKYGFSTLEIFALELASLEKEARDLELGFVNDFIVEYQDIFDRILKGNTVNLLSYFLNRKSFFRTDRISVVRYSQVFWMLCYYSREKKVEIDPNAPYQVKKGNKEVTALQQAISLAQGSSQHALFLIGLMDLDVDISQLRTIEWSTIVKDDGSRDALILLERLLKAGLPINIMYTKGILKSALMNELPALTKKLLENSEMEKLLHEIFEDLYIKPGGGGVITREDFLEILTQFFTEDISEQHKKAYTEALTLNPAYSLLSIRWRSMLKSRIECSKDLNFGKRILVLLLECKDRQYKDSQNSKFAILGELTSFCEDFKKMIDELTVYSEERDKLAAVRFPSEVVDIITHQFLQGEVPVTATTESPPLSPMP